MDEKFVMIGILFLLAAYATGTGMVPGIQSLILLPGETEPNANLHITALDWDLIGRANPIVSGASVAVTQNGNIYRMGLTPSEYSFDIFAAPDARYEVQIIKDGYFCNVWAVDSMPNNDIWADVTCRKTSISQDPAILSDPAKQYDPPTDGGSSTIAPTQNFQPSSSTTNIFNSGNTLKCTDDLVKCVSGKKITLLLALIGMALLVYALRG